MNNTMANVWSTEQVRPQDRLAYWVEVVCRTLVPVDCVAQGSEPFSSQIESDAAGPIRVSAASGTAQIASRQLLTIARKPQDDFALAIHGFGTSALTQLGRDAVLGPGDMILHDMNRPFEFSFRSNWAQTVLLFPREALLRRVGNIDRHIGIGIDGSNGVAAVLSPLLGGLPKHLAHIPDHARERVAENLLDLIATALLASCERPSESSKATLARVKLWIEQHLGEASSAEFIATRCGLSSRHLNRLFAGENTSLMQFVLERRLARCHRDLTDPAMRGRSITDIALTAGFNDLSHFSRTYRTRYGCAPRETRLSPPVRAAGQSAAENSGCQAPVCEHVAPAASATAHASS